MSLNVNCPSLAASFSVVRREQITHLRASILKQIYQRQSQAGFHPMKANMNTLPHYPPHIHTPAFELLSGKWSGLLGEVLVRGISRTEYPVFGFIGMSWISYNELYTGQDTSEYVKNGHLLSLSKINSRLLRKSVSSCVLHLDSRKTVQGR